VKGGGGGVPEPVWACPKDPGVAETVRALVVEDGLLARLDEGEILQKALQENVIFQIRWYWQVLEEALAETRCACSEHVQCTSKLCPDAANCVYVSRKSYGG
jgi:hypothetical protein